MKDEQKQKFYKEALKHKHQYKATVKRNRVDAMLLKAKTYQKQQRRDKAILLVKKTLRLIPNYSKSLTLLARLTKNPMNFRANKKAMKIVDKALKEDPQSDEAWYIKGEIYLWLRDLEGAERCLMEALKINPKNKQARDILSVTRNGLTRSKQKRVKIPEGTPNFLNPEIRKEKFAKQLGFDPITFTPLTEESMVYIHMDGNEDNDDPETHGWVSKESLGRMKSGKLFKGVKSEIGQQRKLIEQHFETYLGGVDKILDDNRGDKYHIDIYILPPNSKRDYGVMATSGMSDFGMRMPSKLKFFQYGELYVKLPPEWPYPMKELKQDDYSWVFQNLFLLPRSVHGNRTFFWNGQVIDNDEPFAGNTKLSGFLIKFPCTIDIPVEFNMLKVNSQKAICFFQLIPLYNEEMNYIEKHGLEKLYKKFDEFRITDVVDLKRPNTC